MLSAWFNSKSQLEPKDIWQKVNEFYSNENLFFTYEVNTSLLDQEIYETKGKLIKTKKCMLKTVAEVTTISDYNHAINIDNRLMKIFYFKDSGEYNQTIDLEPSLPANSILEYDREEDNYCITVKPNTSEIDVTKYYINKYDFYLSKVVHSATSQGDVYISEINYNYSDSPENQTPSLDEVVQGKGENASLKDHYKKMGYSFINTLQN